MNLWYSFYSKTISFCSCTAPYTILKDFCSITFGQGLKSWQTKQLAIMHDASRNSGLYMKFLAEEVVEKIVCIRQNGKSAALDVKQLESVAAIGFNTNISSYYV